MARRNDSSKVKDCFYVDDSDNGDGQMGTKNARSSNLTGDLMTFSDQDEQDKSHPSQPNQFQPLDCSSDREGDQKSSAALGSNTEEVCRNLLRPAINAVHQETKSRETTRRNIEDQDGHPKQTTGRNAGNQDDESKETTRSSSTGDKDRETTRSYPGATYQSLQAKAKRTPASSDEEQPMDEDGMRSPAIVHQENRRPPNETWLSNNKEETVLSMSPGGSIPRSQGEGILNLKRSSPSCQMPTLQPSMNHTVLVEANKIVQGSVPAPHRGRRTDAWDQEHVKMPHSPKNLYQRDRSFLGVKTRWSMITKALGKKLSSPQDIEKAIKSYNKKYERLWKFDALTSFFYSLHKDEQQHYLTNVIPGMARLVLGLPNICPKPIPLLKKREQRAITMSQLQCACLLANAFFCTFPRRNATQGNSEYSSYPTINFNRLFDEENSSKREKLRAIFCYFDQVLSQTPCGLVTFERRHLHGEHKDWSRSPKYFTKLHVSSEGTIEENGKGMLQVDFASPIIGGGVLGSGLVQEEIRFLINTELIVSRLFTEKLNDDESLLITGAEQYSHYDGYSRDFKWRGPMRDTTERDNWQRRCIEIVAIDAIRFHDFEEQFKRQNIERELNKAYCGFQFAPLLPQERVAIATGNWGCGAFKGHPKLKGILQLMAAAEAGRDVAYFTFGNTEFMKELYEMHRFLQNGYTVGQLFNALMKSCKERDWQNMPEFYNELKSKLLLSRM
ncbi:poly(ADP-ribose) glycohydrolase-like [Ambystoma mexicanum]|uniref:poly(ADP-ribose) glycohydrolase-like n=1 Tax=Ambystoma mexicanum TaxID=8296 RepID=UPI0037E9C1C3